MQHIQHKTAIITGAGSGLGRAMAIRFASAGYAVAVTDAREQAATETLQAADFPDGSFALQLDVTRFDQWQQLVDKVSSEWPGLGVIVNNAGVASAGLLEDDPLDNWEWLFAINVMGVANGCRQLLPILKQQNSGHIVNIASFAALAGAPAMSNYGASKAAVFSLSESLYTELAATDIGVTVACPAFISTDLLGSMQHADDSYKKRAQRWMDTSGFSAADFAEAVFTAVGQRRFLLLTHTNTRWMWRLKRFMPSVYYWLLKRSVRKYAQKNTD